MGWQERLGQGRGRVAGEDMVGGAALRVAAFLAATYVSLNLWVLFIRWAGRACVPLLLCR